MSGWDFWDWIAYGGLWIAALVLAKETLAAAIILTTVRRHSATAAIAGEPAKTG